MTPPAGGGDRRRGDGSAAKPARPASSESARPPERDSGPPAGESSDPEPASGSTAETAAGDTGPESTTAAAEAAAPEAPSSESARPPESDSGPPAAEPSAAEPGASESAAGAAAEGTTPESAASEPTGTTEAAGRPDSPRSGAEGATPEPTASEPTGTTEAAGRPDAPKSGAEPTAPEPTTSESTAEPTAKPTARTPGGAGGAGGPPASPTSAAEHGAAGAGGSGQVATALRTLVPPDHGPTFWDDVDRQLADEPQLRLTPRSAIRPITQPPPVIDDRKLAEHLARPGPRPRRSPVRLVAWGLAIAATVVLILAVVQDPDGDTEAGDATTTSATPTTTGSSEDTTTTTAPTTTTVPPGTVDPTAPLAPVGVGPVEIGASLHDLEAAGFTVSIEQSTFDASGGTCYDARVSGALDLSLRVRAAVPGESVADPLDGVIAVVDIRSEFPTDRQTDTGIGLGTPQDRVPSTYAGNVEERPHPFIPGGTVYIAPAGGEFGLATAFYTDGAVVDGIAVGAEDLVRFVNGCV
ncbi:MAG TPA: hypothetical protein VE575_15505 [Acidimicrobiales bacterium]|nr:hypothetical protein [Acidimicrobiales bacterium]